MAIGSASMFETLMSLPLLKGSSTSDIATLVEKIPLEFDRLSAGETIIDAGSKCDSLVFLIEGNVAITVSLFDGLITFRQLIGPGAVFMPCNLFGLHTESPACIKSTTDVSLISISKPDFLSMLEINRIFLVNCLNYISYKSQIRFDILRNTRAESILEFCKTLWLGIGERRAIYTEIIARHENLAVLSGIPESILAKQLNEINTQPDSYVSFMEAEDILIHLEGRPD